MAHGKLGGGNVASDALEQLVGSLDDDAALAHEVAGAQDRERIVGERRKHVRTVRSAARARNRPQRRVAWLIVLIVLGLIALAARIDAAPVGAPADDNDRDVLGRSADGDGDGDDGGGLATTTDDADAGEFTSLTADDDAPGGAAGLDRGSGALAMLDAELAPGDAAAGLDASDAAAPAGAAEAYEERLRQQRPSRWGRVDVGVSWRRRWSAPRNAPPRNYNELWLVATWRR
jgi:hypothetical protein